MHFVKFHPEVASCLLFRGKRKYAPLGMSLLWKYKRSYFLVYHVTSHFLLYLQNYKEFEAEILDLQLEKYGFSFEIEKYTTSSWALGDEKVIGIRSSNLFPSHSHTQQWFWTHMLTLVCQLALIYTILLPGHIHMMNEIHHSTGQSYSRESTNPTWFTYFVYTGKKVVSHHN